MKTFAAVAVCLLFFGALSAQAQEQTAPSPAPQAAASQTAPAAAPIDPAKAADIQRLLEVTGMKSLMEQTMTAMEASVRPNLEKSLPPGEYRSKLIDLFFEKFHTKLNIQDLLDMATTAYDKYLSDDDIKGLIQFYQTPLGQKTLKILPELTVDMQTEAAQKGQQIGRDSMIEVLSEHPELAKALQDAAQAQAATKQ
jgi:uncharacterized protein